MDDRCAIGHEAGEQQHKTEAVGGTSGNPAVFRKSETRPSTDAPGAVHAIWIAAPVAVHAGRCAAGRGSHLLQSIRKDLESGGAKWVDKEVVVDNGITTSRNPGDLDAFTAKIIDEMQEGRRQNRQAAE